MDAAARKAKRDRVNAAVNARKAQEQADQRVMEGVQRQYSGHVVLFRFGPMTATTAGTWKAVGTGAEVTQKLLGKVSGDFTEQVVNILVNEGHQVAVAEQTGG